MASARTSAASAGGVARPAASPLALVQQNVGRVIVFGMLLVFGIIFAFPFYWVLTASVKEAAEIRALPPTWWPHSFTVDAYGKVWSGKFARYFVNSFVYAGSITFIDVVTSTLIGFILIKHPSRLGN